MDLSQLVRRFKILIRSIILVLALVTVVLPLLSWRYCVNILSKIFRKDFEYIVDPMSGTFCHDYERWDSEPDYIVITSVITESGVSLEEIRSRSRKLICKWSNRKLHQHVEKWMGYFFWKNDKDFRIEDHIKLYEDEMNETEVRDDEWLNKVKQRLLRKPFPMEKSPWEIILIPNFKSKISPNKNFCVTLGRFHHVLADGISWKNFKVELLAGTVPMVTPNFASNTKKHFVARLVENLTFLFRAPFIFVKLLDETSDKGKTPWNAEGYLYKKISCSARSKKISLTYLKDIKNKFGVSLNSVILFGVSSILQNLLIKEKIKLPDNVHCPLPLPMPNRPDELCNHITSAVISYPIGIMDPVKRLKAIDRQMTYLKMSIQPQIVYVFGVIVGSLPNILLRRSSLQFFTANVAIVPGMTKRPLFLGRYQLYDESFCLGIPKPHSSAAIFVSCYTSDSALDIDTHVDKSIFDTDNAVEDLYNSVYKDFQKLANSS